MDDLGMVSSRLCDDPPSRRDIPRGTCERGRRCERTARILDDELGHLVPACDQHVAITLHDLILAPGNPVAVVHLENADLSAATRRQVVRTLRGVPAGVPNGLAPRPEDGHQLVEPLPEGLEHDVALAIGGDLDGLA